MERQKSIISYLTKPSPDSRSSYGAAGVDGGGGGGPSNSQALLHRRPLHVPIPKKKPNDAPPSAHPAEADFEVRGTDTPPEKPRRPVFPRGMFPSGAGADVRADAHPVSDYSSYGAAANGGGGGGGSSYSQTLLHLRPPLVPIPQRKRSSELAPALPVEADFDVRGTDTPPEKSRRPVLPSGKFPTSVGADVGATAQPVSSILQKLRRGGDEAEVSIKRNPDGGGSLSCVSGNNIFADEGSLRQGELLKQDPSIDVLHNNKLEPGVVIDIENMFNDVLGPDTPATRPHVSRLKRIQEDVCDFSSGCDYLSANSWKKVKTLHDFGTQEKSNVERSKFEWLSPSRMRDANGRRPGDALYDKRTLYIPPEVLKKMSASQKQYWTVKCNYMDVILFFKVGKFYELYELDAEIGHKELDWKMTFSGVGKCRQVGISEAGIDDAVRKLIARGYKVGRMEQTETSDQAKSRGATSVIQRKLVHVFTPSTAADNAGPDSVHLLSLKQGVLESGSTVYGFAFLDYAALKFWVGSFSDDASCASLGAMIMQVSPREVIYESQGLSFEAKKTIQKYASSVSNKLQISSVLPGTDFMEPSEVKGLIQSKGYFQGSSNSGVSIHNDLLHDDLVISALGGLICHISRLMLDDALRNGNILPYDVYQNCLRMDGQTYVNLEIFCSNADGGSSGTLIKYLDSCITASGKRLLRNWICHPLKNIEEIYNRLNVVETLVKQPEKVPTIMQYLRRLPDLERLLGQVRASVGCSATLKLPLVGEKILKQRVKSFGSLVKGLRTGINLLKIIQQERDFSLFTNILNLPMLGGSGGLDEFLTQFETAVDVDFPQYKDHDVKESDADILAILVELFAEKDCQWSQIIHGLNSIDVLQSFAVTATSSSGSMCKPVIVPYNSTSKFSDNEGVGSILQMKGLWHPYAVSESGGGVVPNDIFLGQDAKGVCPRTLLLTGPNMGGKSTLLRATCLAVILAQLGCYVPSESCILSPVDIIFTRLGATDRIMNGESTFYIECTETASVLKYATHDSLVLLDELGRGTSTFDGYAIAYAVFRHLIEKVHCRLLFATHYHPLTKEFAAHPHVSLQHMACAFRPMPGTTSAGGEELVFLYRLASGACPESYGLQMALRAGIPKPVVEAASGAAQAMKTSMLKNFKSSEGRSRFSTLHEEWLKTLLAVSKVCENSSVDEDVSDTLLCLWHEMNSVNGCG